MTVITIDYTEDSDEVKAISAAYPEGKVADMTDVAWGHRLLYDHARRLAERSEWPCPICGGELEAEDERFNRWVHFYCPQCRISGQPAGSEDLLCKGYEEWADHIRNMIRLSREVV